MIKSNQHEVKNSRWELKNSEKKKYIEQKNVVQNEL
jgi:hypothetical protein